MQIIIDISEDVYTRLFDNGIQDNDIAVDDVCEMARALRLGTPLPKGHGRLKDVDRLESHDECDGQGFTESVYKDDIDSLPTIIEPDTESE